MPEDDPLIPEPSGMTDRELLIALTYRTNGNTHWINEARPRLRGLEDFRLEIKTTLRIAQLALGTSVVSILGLIFEISKSGHT